LKSFLRSVVDVLVDKILGPEERFVPGDRCSVRWSTVAANNGILLKGTHVEVTDVQDPKGRVQVRVVEIPDHDWDETIRLPYGPGFVIFVDPNCLERE
jgi:uncharacterized protein YqhQ